MKTGLSGHRSFTSGLVAVPPAGAWSVFDKRGTGPQFHACGRESRRSTSFGSLLITSNAVRSPSRQKRMSSIRFANAKIMHSEVRQLGGKVAAQACLSTGPMSQQTCEHRHRDESQARFANIVCRSNQDGIDMSKLMTKSELISQIAERSELKKSDVKGVMETLVAVGYKELKKNGSFLVPGFAKFVVIKKPATKERNGINPFTKEPTVFKAKPARKIIRSRPVKAAKDAV
jgi:nucleoid DNA-binding protein